MAVVTAPCSRSDLAQKGTRLVTAALRL